GGIDEHVARDCERMRCDRRSWNPDAVRAWRSQRRKLDRAMRGEATPGLARGQAERAGERDTRLLIDDFKLLRKVAGREDRRGLGISRQVTDLIRADERLGTVLRDDADSAHARKQITLH